MNNKETIVSEFEALNGLRILVLGDVMIDSYLWGTVDRMSPEAPVPVVSVKNREKRLGGAANVALNLKALGCEPIVVSVIGSDTDGQEMIQLFEENNLSTEGLILSDDRVTTIKHRIISDKHLLRVDSEQTDFVSSELEKQLFERTDLLSKNAKCFVFQDYDKGVLTPQFIASSIALAKSKNIVTTVDPKKRSFKAYKETTLFKPNLKEINEALGANIVGSNIEQIVVLGKEFIELQNIENALITLSENGAVLISKDGFKHVNAFKRNIIDVSGAGDTVISVASAFLALGLSIQKVLEYSNLSGGLVCEHIGVVPIDKTMLLEACLLNQTI
jgi:D-glycero-beta-D-manno-heptose-7-phosphate kinase